MPTTMTISLPDEILESDSEDISRKVLEQVALEGLRSGQLTTAQVRRILGLESRLQVYEFLAAHDVPWVNCDDDELQREVETSSIAFSRSRTNAVDSVSSPTRSRVRHSWKISQRRSFGLSRRVVSGSITSPTPAPAHGFSSPAPSSTWPASPPS